MDFRNRLFDWKYNPNHQSIQCNRPSQKLSTKPPLEHAKRNQHQKTRVVEGYEGGEVGIMLF